MRALRLHTLRPEEGFTLVELLVGMIMLGILVAAWSGFLSATVKSSSRTQELSTLQTEVRAVVDKVAIDLRQAQCLNSTTPPVTTSSPTQVTFYSPDRATPYHLQQISYRLSNGQLERAAVKSTNTGAPPWTMPSLPATPWPAQIGSITNTTVFTYKDAAGTATTTPTDVASVNVALTVKPSSGLGGVSASYQTNVNLRTAVCE